MAVIKPPVRFAGHVFRLIRGKEEEEALAALGGMGGITVDETRCCREMFQNAERRLVGEPRGAPRGEGWVVEGAGMV